MASFDVSGKLIEKYDVQQVTDSFKKREFVLEVANPNNSDWNDYLKFQMIQDKVTVIDAFNTGDELRVSFNIKGRKWEKDGQVNYFSNLEAWRIENAGSNAGGNSGGGNQPAAQSAPPPKTDAKIVSPQGGSDDSDLPF